MGGSAIINNSITGYYPDDTFLDYSGNGNDGTISDITTAAIPTGVRSGVFDGSASSCSVGTSLVTGNAFTFMVWMMTDDYTTQQIIMDARPSAGVDGLISIQINANLLDCHIWSEFKKNYVGATTLASDTWFHVACTWDGTNLKIYLNGEEDTPYTKISDDAVTLSDTSQEMYIGSYKGATVQFDGELNDSILLNRALTAQQIKQIYRRTYRS